MPGICPKKSGTSQWPIVRKAVKVEDLGDVEYIFETGLDHKSEDLVVLLMKKTKGKKSHATVLLIQSSTLICLKILFCTVTAEAVWRI
jgi:hypothetical protein